MFEGEEVFTLRTIVTMYRPHIRHLALAALLLSIALGAPLEPVRVKDPCSDATRRAVRACGFGVKKGADLTTLSGVFHGVEFPLIDGYIAPSFLSALCSNKCVDIGVCALECFASQVSDVDMHGMTILERAKSNDLVRFSLCTYPEGIMAPLAWFPGQERWDEAERRGVWKNAFNFRGVISGVLREKGPSVAFNKYAIARVGHSGRCPDGGE